MRNHTLGMCLKFLKTYNVQLTIQNISDKGLPESFTKDIYEEKSSLVFQHVYDSYYGDEKSVYQELQ